MAHNSALRTPLLHLCSYPVPRTYICWQLSDLYLYFSSLYWAPNSYAICLQTLYLQGISNLHYPKLCFIIIIIIPLDLEHHHFYSVAQGLSLIFFLIFFHSNSTFNAIRQFYLQHTSRILPLLTVSTCNLSLIHHKFSSWVSSFILLYWSVFHVATIINSVKSYDKFFFASMGSHHT